MMRVEVIIRGMLLMIAALMVTSCAVNPVTGKSQIMLMSEAQEVQMGLQYDPQVISTFGEYNNPAMLAFVQNQCTQMGKISHRPNLEYHIKILDSPVINAFAVPGGFIYLTRGILAQLNNEAELAGVIGHEMGHITARHSVSQQSKQQMGQILLIGGMLISEKMQEMASYAMQGMQLLFLKFSRDDERQADQLGVEYSSKIGYDASKMADFFQVLNKMNMESEHAGVPTFLSTHPDPGDRYNSVHQYARAWQDSLKYPSWKVNNEAYLKLIDGIIYGADPRQGYVENNVFYHPEMKFRFIIPAGWQLENSPMQVSMAPKDGKAMLVFTLSDQKTLEDAVSNSIKELQLNLQETRTSTVNDLPAIFAMSKQVSKDESTGQEQSIPVLSCFINYNNSIYVLHGLTAESDYTTFTPVFESTMKSFARLTDQSKINVKPKKIIIRQVQSSGTLSGVLKSFGVQQNMMEELALLNNLTLTDQVQKGKLIKIVGE